MNIIYGIVEAAVVLGGFAILAAIVLLLIMLVYNAGIGSGY